MPPKSFGSREHRGTRRATPTSRLRQRLRLRKHQDGSTVTLYGVKKVKFTNQDGTSAVRVTRNNDSTETYENPKNVEFGE